MTPAIHDFRINLPAPPATVEIQSIPAAISAARAAQTRWSANRLGTRLVLVRELRHLIAESAAELSEVSASARHRPSVESLTAEVLPMAEACRFLEREAETILATRHLGGRGLPLWLLGVRREIRREPLGIVLIIGPRNYPLLLPGVQLIQALVAGNAVLFKPGVGGTAAARALHKLIVRAGFDPRLLLLLPESPEAARAAIEAHPDKVLFTGSAETGEIILHQLAPRLIPATMELSGADAVVVRADADLDLVVKALVFGLTLNGGATCLAPKRVFVHRSIVAGLESRLARALPFEMSLRLPSVLAVVSVGNDDEAVTRANDCLFALGASVFTRDQSAARELATRLNAGVVSINDLIVPTADARVPFGGRKRSGFGVTRGAEGLLELTALKVVTVSRGRFRPAFGPAHPGDAAMFQAYLTLTHGRGLGRRARALGALFRSLTGRTKHSKQSTL